MVIFSLHFFSEVIKVKEETCRFVGVAYRKYCSILVGVQCDGTNKICKFYKTEKQFRQERDRNIITNRIKGNCGQCRYMGTPCRLSTEKER